jgi:hypothetical protein
LEGSVAIPLVEDERGIYYGLSGVERPVSRGYDDGVLISVGIEVSGDDNSGCDASGAVGYGEGTIASPE